MPLYEYICEDDGSVIELRRPMSEADEPVEDPEGRGRAFRRRLSSFRALSAGPTPGPTSGPMGGPGACPCGMPGGACPS